MHTLYLHVDGSTVETEGVVQKCHLLNSLCGCQYVKTTVLCTFLNSCQFCSWEPSCVLHIADMCKDIFMTSEELEFLIQKILR